MQNLIRHNIPHSRQSVYVSNKNTDNAIARINNDILVIEIGTNIVFLDLSAAFDTLNHTILFTRLANTSSTCKSLD